MPNIQYLAWSFEGKDDSTAWQAHRQRQQLRPGFWKELQGVMEILVDSKLLFPTRFVFQLPQGERAVRVPDEIKDQASALLAFLRSSFADSFFESIVEVEGETWVAQDGSQQPQIATGRLKVTEFDGLSRRFSFMLSPWAFVPIVPLGGYEYELKGNAWIQNAACLTAALRDLQRLLHDWEGYPQDGEVIVDEIFVQSGHGIMVHPNVLDLLDTPGDAQVAAMRQSAADLLARRS